MDNDTLTSLPPSPIHEEDEKVYEEVNQENGRRRAIYELARIHRYSAYAFTSFLGLHWSTTGLIPLFEGREGGDRAILLARVAYQHAVCEKVLLAAAGGHVLSGIGLRLIRMSIHREWYGRARHAITSMSSTSATGYALSAIVACHVILNRLIPLYLEGDSSDVGLNYVAHGFARHKALSVVFYASLVSVGVYHVSTGFQRFLKMDVSKRTRRGLVVAWSSVGLAWLGSALLVIGRPVNAAPGLIAKYNRWYRCLWPGF